MAAAAPLALSEMHVLRPLDQVNQKLWATGIWRSPTPTPGDREASSELSPPPPQVHAYIISYLKKEMPSVFGKENKKKQLILKLPVIFAKIQLEHHISPGDFPDCQKMQVGGCPRGRQKGLASLGSRLWDVASKTRW